ncbi:MAG TPA: DNA polymerase III subunit beta [Candidatus Saccharimonadales bacterium]
MKLQVTQENLNRALGSVARVADSHGTLPILANVLIKADKNRLSVSATNLDIGITHFVGAKIEKEGVITVPANLLANFISSLPQGVISLELEDNKLNITTNQYQSTINGIAADDFPVMPAIEKGAKFSIDAHGLKKGLQQVVFAAANNDTRPVLTGVYIHSKAGQLYMAATDSSRLAEKTIAKTSQDIKLLIPASAMNDMLRILDDEVDSVNITQDDQQALFHFDDIELVSRLIDSAYPDYQSLIPKKHLVRAVLKRADLLNIVKVSSLFARETAGSITIEVNEDDQTVGIKSLASQLGENTATASGEIEGSGSITLNSKFLIDGINAFNSDSIDFSFNGKLEPVLLKDPKSDDYRHVIMPLKA